ncbi:MAG: hypothetical protein KAU20_05585 [Nanoarchaeota archaeon]|nr:hypothetical protein [Nanoarchaeota archaeon]
MKATNDKINESISNSSLEVAAQRWCLPTTKHFTMIPELAKAFADIIEKYRRALIWCGGSDDFARGGKAEIGFNKICRPLIEGRKED